VTSGPRWAGGRARRPIRPTGLGPDGPRCASPCGPRTAAPDLRLAASRRRHGALARRRHGARSPPPLGRSCTRSLIPTSPCRRGLSSPWRRGAVASRQRGAVASERYVSMSPQLRVRLGAWRRVATAPFLRSSKYPPRHRPKSLLSPHRLGPESLLRHEVTSPGHQRACGLAPPELFRRGRRGRRGGGPMGRVAMAPVRRGDRGRRIGGSSPVRQQVETPGLLPPTLPKSCVTG
jgi:hypothetical protein